MEQLTQKVTIRVSDEDMQLLKTQAAEQRRSVAWVARENMRKGFVNATP